MSTEIATRNEYKAGRILPIGNAPVKEVKNVPIPIIGKIKIGEKAISKKTGKEYPVALDYFIVTDTKYANQFKEAYGEKPDKLEIAFPSDDVEQYCYESYQIRDSKGKLLAEGNGKLWEKLYNNKEKDYNYKKEIELEKLLNHYDKLGFKPDVKATLTLRFILLKLKGVFGCWQFVTKGSASSIPSIRNTYDYIMQYASTTVNIPFDLTVKKVSSQIPGDTRTYPVVSIVANLSKESIDVLSEYVESGHTIKGMITEEKLLQLSSSSELQQLPPKSIEDSIITAEVVDDNEVELELTPEGNTLYTTTNANYLDEEQKNFMLSLVEESGIKMEWLGELLFYKGINSIDEFPVDLADDFVEFLQSGNALKKAKELFN